MTTVDDLIPVVELLATMADPGRTPGGCTTLVISVAGSPWLCCTADERGITVTQPTEPAPDGPLTEVDVSAEGLRSWLLGGVDFTHLLKAGQMRIRSGTYFDVLLL